MAFHDCPYECETCFDYVVFGVNEGCRKGRTPKKTLEQRVEVSEKFIAPIDWPGYVVLHRQVEELNGMVSHLRNEVALLTAKKKSKYA